MAGGRTSARSSVTRESPASPPKQSLRRSQTPALRTTRLTRSQSADIGDSDTGTTARRRGPKRGARQPSVESVARDESTIIQRRKGKATRAAVNARNLSMVAEDQEPEQSSEDEDAEMIDTSDQEQLLRSARAESQTSTTYSTAEMELLSGPRILDSLPELLEKARKILNLLVSMQSVELITRDLQLPGERALPSLLNVAENEFKDTRDIYGPENFINPAWMLKKFFEPQKLWEGNFRPDAVIHAANLATMVKELLVLKSESPDAETCLYILDRDFPVRFLSGFSDEIQYGNSALLDQSFDFGLEIRTQFLISQLTAWRRGEQGSQQNVQHPHTVLNLTFRDSGMGLAHFDDVDGKGHLKPIAGVSTDEAGEERLEEQASKTRARIELIESAFYEEKDAIANGDSYDEEKLASDFPWLQFQETAIAWIRARQMEIDQSIRKQGGVENIMRSLTIAAKDANSQVHVDNNLHDNFVEPPPKLLPPADITPATAGKSLFKPKKGLRASLQNLKQATTAPQPKENPSKATTILQSSMSVNNSTASPGPSKRNEQAAEYPNDFMQPIDDNEEEMFVPSSAHDYLSQHRASQADRNKENLKSGAKRKFTDRQPTAHKVQWDQSQDDGSVQGNLKRPQQNREDTEDIEDGDFESDQRIPNATRRATAPTARRSNSAQQSGSRKRQRVQQRTIDEDQEDDSPFSDQEQDEELQANARRQAREESEGDEEPLPRPSQVFSMARIIAKKNTFEASRRLPQKRVPWSLPDTDRLIELIGKYGCSWQHIDKMGDFEVDRGQVGLKDKARNLKVLLLRAGAPLPTNFEHVPLGKKEVASVKAARLDYQDEDPRRRVRSPESE